MDFWATYAALCGCGFWVAVDGALVTLNGAVGFSSRNRPAWWLVVLITASFGLSIAIERLHMPPIMVHGIPMPFQPLALAILDFGLLLGFRFVCHDDHMRRARLWLTLIQIAALMAHIFAVMVYGARVVHAIDRPTYVNYSWLYSALLEVLFWASITINLRASLQGGFDVVALFPWLHRPIRGRRVRGSH